MASPARLTQSLYQEWGLAPPDNEIIHLAPIGVNRVKHEFLKKVSGKRSDFARPRFAIDFFARLCYNVKTARDARERADK